MFEDIAETDKNNPLYIDDDEDLDIEVEKSNPPFFWNPTFYYYYFTM